MVLILLCVEVSALFSIRNSDTVPVNLKVPIYWGSGHFLQYFINTPEAFGKGIPSCQVLCL